MLKSNLYPGQCSTRNLIDSRELSLYGGPTYPLSVGVSDCARLKPKPAIDGDCDQVVTWYNATDNCTGKVAWTGPIMQLDTCQLDSYFGGYVKWSRRVDTTSASGSTASAEWFRDSECKTTDATKFYLGQLRVSEKVCSNQNTAALASGATVTTALSAYGLMSPRGMPYPLSVDVQPCTRAISKTSPPVAGTASPTRGKCEVIISAYSASTCSGTVMQVMEVPRYGQCLYDKLIQAWVSWNITTTVYPIRSDPNNKIQPKPTGTISATYFQAMTNML